MALATTTLSSAMGIGDSTMSLTATTSIAPGRIVRIDNEVLETTKGWISGPVGVLRGRDGTATQAHPAGANVTHGLATDFANPSPGGPVVTYPAQRAMVITSYTVAGAITLPTPGSNATAILNGVVALAMTLANPTKDQDGDRLVIESNGKAAHTVTYTAGLGNVGGTADVLTFSATQTGAVELVAANGFWNALVSVAGAATIGGVGIA